MIFELDDLLSQMMNDIHSIKTSEKSSLTLKTESI